MATSSSSKSANNGGGDVLMLEAPPSERPAWLIGAEVIDALPYIDYDYADPQVKLEVDNLIEAEMNNGSSKKPPDLLDDFPPPPPSKFNSKDHPMLAKEYERLRKGRAPTGGFQKSRIDVPPENKWNDETAWKQSVQGAQRFLQHQVIRLENLDLLSKHGPELWKLYNRRLEAFLSQVQSQHAELREKIETVNRERKYHQQNTAYELNALSTQWRELCLKNIEIQTACAGIENQIEEMKREATERGWNLDLNVENGSFPHPQ